MNSAGHLQQGSNHAIREAIDTCPEGLCFAAGDGRPILVNSRMNALAVSLTGRALMDAGLFWAQLLEFRAGRGCERVHRPPSGSGEPEEREDLLAFRLADGSVWRFRRTVMEEACPHVVQLEAAEITDLFRLSRELYENNVRLLNLHQRQRSLLANIVQINRDKELLKAKMQIHDELGRCLIATRRALAGELPAGETGEISQAWEDAIRNLTNIPLTGTAGKPTPEMELRQVAEMIGCTIDFRGERPASRQAQLLLYAVVREALTNAVRHAGANRLTVAVRREGPYFHAEVSSNGTAPSAPIREGDGLGNLRARLEQEGAALEVRSENGVTLIADIPAQP